MISVRGWSDAVMNDPRLRERVLELERSLLDEVGEAAASPVMVFVADLVEGRFLEFNDAVCEVLGHTRDEIIESSFIDRVHPEDLSRTMLEMQNLATGGRTASFQNRHLGADGEYRTFAWASFAEPHLDLCYAVAVIVDE